MEFRESLLQNDIQHLNKNFSLVSAELIVIQDFLEQEFGVKFQAFLNARREQRRLKKSVSTSQRHVLPSQAVFSSDGYSQSQASSMYYHKRNDLLRKNRESISTPGISAQRMVDEECAEIFEEESIIPDGMEESDSDSDIFDPIVSVDDSGEEREVKPNINVIVNDNELSDLNATEPEPGRPGRRRSIIHRYFEKVQTEDGKMKDKCFTCGSFVSGQAQRLRKHILKCRGRDSKVEEVIQKFKLPKEKEVRLNGNKVGRRFDRVRLVFREHKLDDGILKMQCVNCNQLVSNQASRMRKHIEKCNNQQVKDKGHRNNQEKLMETSTTTSISILNSSASTSAAGTSSSSKSCHDVPSHESKNIKLSPARAPSQHSASCGPVNSVNSHSLVTPYSQEHQPVSADAKISGSNDKDDSNVSDQSTDRSHVYHRPHSEAWPSSDERGISFLESAGHPYVSTTSSENMYQQH